MSTSNYDVSTRGCVGANVNAVSKSGGNDFHGRVLLQVPHRRRQFHGQDRADRQRLEQAYTGWDREWTAGFDVGGPIIKDTLFFFASYEKAERVGIGAASAPQDGTGSTTLVQGLTTDFFNKVNAQATAFGLIPGDRSLSNLTDKRYLAKIDWNISDSQRAVFRYSETKEDPAGTDGQLDVGNAEQQLVFQGPRHQGVPRPAVQRLE